MVGNKTEHEQATGDPAAKAKPWERFRNNHASTTNTGGASGHSLDGGKLRSLLASTLWAVCVVFALILALAVLLIAVEANARNELVRWIISRADDIDLGFFDLSNPIKDFDQGEADPAQDVKTALFNYGIAAVIWLVIGKILDKVVRA